MFIINKQFFFVVMMLLWLIFRIIKLFQRYKNKGIIFIKREILINIFFIYILLVLTITFLPMFIGLHAGEEIWISINLVPFINTYNAVMNITDNPDMHNFMIEFWAKNIIGNIVMFLPLGVFLPVLYMKYQNYKKVVFIGFCSSLSIEILQLLSGFIGNSGRTFDIDDILLNVAGAYIGYNVFYKLIKYLLNKNIFSERRKEIWKSKK